MAITPSTHRQPTADPVYPPTIGPRAGPRKAALANTDIPRPLCDAGNISATVPPAFVRGEEPNAPAKNRRMSSV
ncbi:unnamed protein product [Didymodactylos carnosus]|uniref:Uncharacterized protein n=1 Tax=Didymodactylos carnosus TaxID=1234261 RepID=A0A8S2DXF7_9BILA|nr:unnamed protein product [Didymodactylos carnosus]CAF3827029.1 unnamed protein product [Didymodactylos carnosus]